MQPALATPSPGLETTGTTANYRYDLRTTPPDLFEDLTHTDWSKLTWDEIGRPYLVDNYSKRRLSWEAEQGREMPVEVQWEHFNKHFHDLFIADLDNETSRLRKEFGQHLKAFDTEGMRDVLAEMLRIKVWNKVHRVEDAVWDPRGKRALFGGLDVERPNILFLGAADGYEAMQMLAMYPGGHAVLVDYDPFCETDRFGKFPEAYPFLGQDPATGQWKTYYRTDFDITFEVADIRDLKYGKEFDIVVSVGLLEHFPDEYKPLAVDFHRRFLKPGGYVIMTTPRKQPKSKLFYMAMGEIMNFGYRELMNAHQLGLYAYENGLDILRAGYIKAHNGVVARLR
ncbi:MAG: class I SAM-dependent methyltransferase [Bacteroidota bacterium]